MHILRHVAFVSLCLLGTEAGAAAQSTEPVRITLLEASARRESPSCTLEVVVRTTAGEAILTCSRTTPPASQLGAHRALTTAEATRLHALAAKPAAPEAQRSGSPSAERVDRAKAIVTIVRGPQRVVLDASDGPNGLSAPDQQILRLLRELVDELRGTARQ